MTTNSNLYPFETKAQIAAKIADSTEYALQALVTIWSLQTSFEQEKLTTEVRNHRGFMSSHAVVGSKLAQKVQSGEPLTQEETEKAVAIAARYTKQLAAYSRRQAIESNPELAQASACFFTVQK